MSVPAESVVGMIGRDEHRNPIWVRGDGPYADMPGLTPAPVEAAAAATEPEETEAKADAGAATATDAGTAEEVDPFDEDEALAAAAEEEAAAEAAEPTWRLRVYVAGGLASLSGSLASCAAPGAAAHADCDAPGNTAGDSAHELDAMMRKSAHVACVEETASAQATAFWRASYLVGSAGSRR